jgi:flagellar hook-associated protein 3 FlgL
MPFRVTQNMMNTSFMSNLNSNLIRMSNLQDQIDSSRRINKPSDDPVGISYSLRYRSEITENDQYASNLDSAKSWMDNTDSALDKAGSVLQRIRELTVQASNGTNSKQSLDSIQSEVGQLYQEMASIGNGQFNGKYVFNGQLTDVKPYSIPNAEDTATIDNTQVQFSIGSGVKMPINVTGTQVFGASTDTDNVFAVTKQLITDLKNNNSTGINNALSLIDSRMDKFLSIRADVGAKMNRIDLVTNRITDTGVNLQEILSKTEDADIPGTLTNFKTAQNVYQASLSVGAKLIQPSLIDFLR